MSTCEPTAPLSEADAEELRSEGLSELVVEVDGKLYCDEDLYHCEGCSMRTPDKWDLDDERLCEECASEARAEEEHVRQLRSDYYASVL